MASKRSGKPSHRVTQARATAQRARLDAQAEARQDNAEQESATPKKTRGKKDQRQGTADLACITVEPAIRYAPILRDFFGGLLQR